MSSSTLGEIITFYSYKGGTGRSMALSNVACILAEKQSKGKGVLMIDWDLEAPGLHRYFHDKFKLRYGNSKESANKFALNPGLIDLFLEFECLTPKLSMGSNEEAEKNANEVLKNIDLTKFVVKTDIDHLSLLKAGCFDKNYSTKVNTFNWEDLYNRSPYLFLSFAEKLVREYKYILIDSRTGYTDISGICTALMPQKLVVVFTPNRQNYMGAEEIIRTVTDYRRKSEDLRPLLVYPLPTRIESSRDDLRAEWRFGNPKKLIKGYQPMFEELFSEVYDVSNCNLKSYFEDVQIQHSPDYAYGEEIAVLVEKIEDRFSLSKSYRVFTEWLLKSNAPWQRLNQEVVPKTISNVPYLRNLNFIDRKKELEQIHEALISGNAVAVSQPIAICGLGGIGKTQVAVEYAYRYYDEYRFILWVKADSEDSIISDYIVIAKLLNLPAKNDLDQNIIVSSVLNWLTTHVNWLLIFDDADNISFVKKFLPPSPIGHIILTSRLRIFDDIETIKLVELKEMLPEEAKDYMLKRTGRAYLNQSELEALEKLVYELDCLPLALEQAGAYIHANNSSFKDYLVSYKIRGLKLLEKSTIDKSKYPESISTTWLMSFEEVKKNSEVSADILFASAFLHPHEIPYEIFYKGGRELGSLISAAFSDFDKDPLIFDEILKPLWQYSLINCDAGCRTYDINRLVQVVVRDRMKKDEQHLWVERTIKAINCAFPDIEYKNWELCDKLLPHAQTCAEYIALWNIETEESAKLLNATGSYLHKRGRFKESESLLIRSLEIRKKVLETDHLDISESLNNLGELYRDLGRYSEAEPLYLRSLEIRENTLNPYDPDIAQSLNNIAELYRYLGRYSEAEQLYLRALEIRENTLNPYDPAIAESLDNLAEVYRSLGRHSEIEPLYIRALEITEKALGSEHPDVGTRLNNLAGVYKALGRYSEAEPLYTRALEIAEKTLGPEHPHIGTCLNNLATVYRDWGRYSKAESLYTRALKITEKALSSEHPNVAVYLNSIATVYSLLGRYSEAEPLYTRALEITEKVFGSEHPDVGTRLNNLAGVYSDLGRFSEAESLYIRALEITEKALGPEHPKVAVCLKNLAIFFHKQRKYLKARPYYERAIEVMEKTKGENSLEFVSLLEDYASLLNSMKINRKATMISNRAKDIRPKIEKEKINKFNLI